MAVPPSMQLTFSLEDIGTSFLGGMTTGGEEDMECRTWNASMAGGGGLRQLEHDGRIGAHLCMKT